MESNLKKISWKFYILDVTITGMCCLGLLDCGNQNAVHTLEEMLSSQDEEEVAELFGLDDVNLDSEIAFELILDQRKGWLVLGEGAHPRNPSFDKDGKVTGYTCGGVYNMLYAYQDTLEEALTDIAIQAEAIREDVFNKARKEQGLPVVAAVEGAA